MRTTDLPFDPAEPGPFQHLLGKLADLNLPEPTGWHILVAQYVRPERSAGGIIMSAKTLQEDAWQNRMGMVLALGPDAYSDPVRHPSGRWVKPGDTIVWKKLDNAASKFEMNGVQVCLLNDDAVIAREIDVLQAFG